ncbi:AMP-binding protein [Okibacterium fritillariae]|uniref:AMP-binding protein n=1 Tax=Okibacterium fritillariae TaxID=123320 RepID=UPI0040558F3A
MSPTPATASFLAARDILLDERENAAAARERFRWPDVGAHFNWAVDWFDAIALENDSVALWIVEEDGRETKVSFREMSRRSNQVANWMRERGVRQGDHVMLMLGNQVELWETMLAIMKLGAVILPTSTVLGADELADRIDRADVSHVIANAADAPLFSHLRSRADRSEVGRIAVGDVVDGWSAYGDSNRASDDAPGVLVSSDDPALIYFTSGTTSKPKMVVHTHSSYPVGHLSTLSWLGLQPGDVHLAISSPGWGKHAWSCFFAPWIAEATVFVYNYSRFDAKALVAQLDRARVTTFCAPPTVWRMLIQNDITERPGALREILSAGEPLNPEVISRIRRWWGLVIRDGYGQTETTAIIANPPGSALVAGSMGTPLPGVTIALIDPLTGEPGDEGEICIDLSVAPVNLMSGYLGDEAKTATAMADGYFHTGDVASRDERGYITFIGRTDDIFKSSDYKVSPFEVESLLLEHDAVAEAAVVGAPDDIRLNVTKAYVALADGWAPNEATAREILRHAAEVMPPYMKVRRVEFFELPKTASGKIRRVELRDREVQAAQRRERLPREWREGDTKPST